MPVKSCHIISTIERNGYIACLLDERDVQLRQIARMLRKELDDDLLFNESDDYLYLITNQHTGDAYIVLLPFEVNEYCDEYIKRIADECENGMLLSAKL